MMQANIWAWLTDGSSGCSTVSVDSATAALHIHVHDKLPFHDPLATQTNFLVLTSTIHDAVMSTPYFDNKAVFTS